MQKNQVRFACTSRFGIARAHLQCPNVLRLLQMAPGENFFHSHTHRLEGALQEFAAARVQWRATHSSSCCCSCAGSGVRRRPPIRLVCGRNWRAFALTRVTQQVVAQLCVSSGSGGGGAVANGYALRRASLAHEQLLHTQVCACARVGEGALRALTAALASRRRRRRASRTGEPSDEPLWLRFASLRPPMQRQ